MQISTDCTMIQRSAALLLLKLLLLLLLLLLPHDGVPGLSGLYSVAVNFSQHWRWNSA